MDRLYALVLLTLLVCFMATAPVAAQSVMFPLEGSQEVPPVTTDATGSCQASLNGLGTAFTVSCTNDVQDVIGAHIHMAPAGENGPIVFFFDAGTTFTGTVSEMSLMDQQNDPMTPVTPVSFEEFLSLLEAGNLYVNVHSMANPPGEVRGQIPPPPSVLTFPQFGNGEVSGVSLQSDIVLLNTATTGAPADGTIVLYDADGNPLPVDGLFGDGNGMMSPSAFNPAVHTMEFSIDPQGDLTVSTTGMGELVQGSAQVVTTGNLAGFIRFGVSGVGVAGVPVSPATGRAVVPARRSGSLSTGLAIRNLESTPIMVNLSLRANGVEVANGNVDIMINPNARTSMFIEQYFPDADTSDFNGTVVMSSMDGGFSALGLEFDAANNINTTLPVTPLP